MRKFLPLSLTSLLLFLIPLPNAYSYSKIDLATTECLTIKYGINYSPNLNHLPNCEVAVEGSLNPIRRLAEKQLLGYLNELSYKDGVALKKSNFYLEPNLSKNYLNYSKAAIGLSEEFWGSKISNPVNLIVSTKSIFYRESLCRVYYKLSVEKRDGCNSTTLDQFGNFWPSDDNPNVFGGVFNMINESDVKGNIRVDYPALFIFLNQNEKNQGAPNSNYTRTLIHEYTHIAQYGFLGDHNPANYINNNFMSNSPTLFTEGSAQYLGTALNHLYFKGSYDLSFKPGASWVKNNLSIKELYQMNRADLYKDGNLSQAYYSGGLMTELFIANFGIKNFFLINSCLTNQKSGGYLPFEKCFSRVTGYSFLDWSELASNYVKAIYSSQTIDIEDYQLENLSKISLYDTYQVEQINYLQGKVEVKFKIKSFGQKETTKLNLYSVKGEVLCNALELFCPVYNSQIQDNALYLNGDGLNQEEKIDITGQKPSLDSISNLLITLDNSSNRISSGMGLDNSLLMGSWEKSNSGQLPNSSETPINPVISNAESYQVEILGCSNERVFFTTSNLNFQFPCLNKLTSLKDNITVKVRVVTNDGVSEVTEFVYNPISIYDILPVKDLKLNYLNNNLKISYKKYVQREYERKLKIEKISKGVNEVLYVLLDSSNSYDLAKILDGKFERVRLTLLLRAKGESNFDYGLAVKSNTLELKVSQINFNSNVITPVPVEDAKSTPVENEVKVDNGLKKVPIKNIPSKKVLKVITNK